MKAGPAASFYTLQIDRFQKSNPLYSVSGKMEEEEESFSVREAKRMRSMLKELRKSAEQDRSHAGSSKQNNLFDELSGASDEEEGKAKVKKISRYNYKEVAGKIRQAKTSASAALALVAAKRKVAEVKRKISNGEGDPEELQLDLTHAKRMEMAARKKRHNLELEELVEHTGARDERLDREAEASEGMEQAMTEMAEEETAEREDAVFEERQDMLEEAMEMTGGKGNITDDMLSEMNAMIAEYGEELLEELEEQMEQLESMETVNPHMSEEKLQELKKKHRAAENRAMVKADMDYLKGMIKHMQEKGADMTGNFGSAMDQTLPSALSSGLLFSASAGSYMSAALSDAGLPSVDVAL